MFFCNKRIFLVSYRFYCEKNNTGFGNIDIYIDGKIKNKFGFTKQLREYILENCLEDGCKFKDVIILSIFEVK
jgi:hypothetical protein